MVKGWCECRIGVDVDFEQHVLIHVSKRKYESQIVEVVDPKSWLYIIYFRSNKGFNIHAWNRWIVIESK